MDNSNVQRGDFILNHQAVKASGSGGYLGEIGASEWRGGMVRGDGSMDRYGGMARWDGTES